MVSSTTVKKLFAASKNICALINCYEPIYEAEYDSVVGEICHLKDKNKFPSRAPSTF